MKLDEQMLARRFAALTPEARRGFLGKLRDAGLSFAELPIVAADRAGPLPLSYAQRGLWPVSYTHLTLPTKRIV